MEEWTNEMLQNFILQHAEDEDQYWVEQAQAILNDRT